MFTSLSIFIFGLILLWFGIDIVKKERQPNIRNYGTIVATIGFVVCILAIFTYPYINIWETRLAGEALLVRAEFEGKAHETCVSYAK